MPQLHVLISTSLHSRLRAMLSERREKRDAQSASVVPEEITRRMILLVSNGRQAEADALLKSCRPARLALPTMNEVVEDLLTEALDARDGAKGPKPDALPPMPDPNRDLAGYMQEKKRRAALAAQAGKKAKPKLKPVDHPKE